MFKDLDSRLAVSVQSRRNYYLRDAACRSLFVALIEFPAQTPDDIAFKRCAIAHWSPFYRDRPRLAARAADALVRDSAKLDPNV